MMIRIKSGVNIKNLKPQMTIAVVVINEVYLKHGIEECWITSADDSKHGRQTLHDFGYAIDIRTWNIPDDIDKVVLAGMAGMYLGDQFDVILELDHIHIEFDPRK